MIVYVVREAYRGKQAICDSLETAKEKVIELMSANPEWPLPFPDYWTWGVRGNTLGLGRSPHHDCGEITAYEINGESHIPFDMKLS